MLIKPVPNWPTFGPVSCDHRTCLNLTSSIADPLHDICGCAQLGLNLVRIAVRLKITTFSPHSTVTDMPTSNSQSDVFAAARFLSGGSGAGRWCNQKNEVFFSASSPLFLFDLFQIREFFFESLKTATLKCPDYADASNSTVVCFHCHRTVHLCSYLNISCACSMDDAIHALT